MKTKTSNSNDMLTDNLFEPLNDTTAAKVNIDSGAGNLTIDSLTSGEPALASGTLQYLQKLGPPTRTLDSSSGQATLTLRGGNAVQPRFRFPWSVCNGAADWEIHLNPTVSLDINAHSGGGNVKIDLSGMTIPSLAADSGGGNMEVVLPDSVADQSVVVKSGAGNVIVQLPGSIAARIYASSGLGKVIVDSRFNKIDGKTYQSPDYDGAANKVEITASTGAGNVIVNTK